MKYELTNAKRVNQAIIFLPTQEEKQIAKMENKNIILEERIKKLEELIKKLDMP